MLKTTLTIVMAALCLNFSGKAQTINQIKGRITTASDQKPLPGATVKIKSTSITTQADGGGLFTINSPANEGILIITYLGCKTIEVSFKGNQKEQLQISLEEDNSHLKEVEINAGYYTVKDKEKTGSIARVTAETIGKQPVSNIMAALVGQMPGVQIAQQTGVPGGDFSIQIRGQNSLRKNSGEDGNLPFYIVDGVPIIPATFGNSTANRTITNGNNPLSGLNPGDIESVEVLKDADATAIYGSRGANGVVLITTKKGQTGKAKIDLNLTQGFGKVSEKMKLLNTEQYLQMRKEAFANDGVTPTISNAQDLLLWDQNRETDWQKVLLGGTAKSTNAQGTISGGSAGMTYLISGAYDHQQSVFPGKFGYSKASGHINLNHTSENKKFQATFSASYGAENNNMPGIDLTGAAMLMEPNAPEGYDAQGNLNWKDSYYDNPYYLLALKYKGTTNTLVSNFNLSYEVIKDLKLKVNFAYNKSNINEIQTNPLSAFNPDWGYISGYTYFVTNNSETWLVEPQLEYARKIKDGNLSLLIGSTFQKNRTKGSSLYADGFSSDELLENITAASNITGERFNDTPYNYNAVFGRINYNWQGKYIVNLTGRRDGSSRFGPGRQFANFGAAGLAWVFAKEPFVQSNLPFLSTGKFRGSLGVTGSDQIGDYQFLDVWKPTFYPYDGRSGLIPSRLFNPYYGWEKNRKMEAAIDLGVFGDRILFSAGYYQNKSSNQLVGYALAPTTGFSSVTSNLPATVQNTGLELELHTRNIDRPNFKWNTSFNITIPKTKLLNFPGIETSSYAAVYKVGEPLSVKRTYVYTGVDPESGTYTFDGDRQDFLKRIDQSFYGGLQNSFTYHSFQLDMSFQFIKQTGYNYLSTFYTAPGGMGNQPQYVLDHWNGPASKASIQKYTQNSSDSYATLRQSDQGIGDASFIRLKNVYLSYQMPKSLSGKLKLQNLKIYLQAQNVFTITKYKGLDPETQRSDVLPPLRMITAGIQLSL